AMEKHGLKRRLIYAEGMDEKSARDVFEEIKDDIYEKKITTLFCSQDMLAINLMNACYDNDIHVPEDISFAGFGGSQISEIYRPKLTTIKEPYYDLGAVAIRSLLKVLEDEGTLNTTEPVLLPVQ